MSRCLVIIISAFSFLNCPCSQGSEMILFSRQQNTGFTPCTDNTDCDNFQNAVCVKGFCECSGSRFCDDKPEVKVTKLGITCSISADCLIEHSVCEEKKCQCKKGRVGSEDKRKCLKEADGLGSTCDDSIQCYTKVPQSGCQNKKCVCQQKTHAFNGSCFTDVVLGEKCTQLGNCTITPFARCLEDKCTCKEGYVPSGTFDKCLMIARRIDDPCYEDIQCFTKFGRAVCQEGFCKCENPYLYKSTKEKCVQDLLLSEKCENDTNCLVSENGENRLECIMGECKCRSEYVEEYGACTSAGEHLVHLPSVLLVIFGLTCAYLNNIYALWFLLFYGIFFMCWITFLGRRFFENNNYLALIGSL